MSYKEFVSHRIENIRDSDLLTFAAAMGLAPWLVPIAPALVFGWFFYANVTGAKDYPMDPRLALVGAVAIAIGLVVAGAMSSHTAVTLQGYGVNRGKIIFAWSTVVAYVLLEIGGLLAMEMIGAYLIVVGIVASLLTLDVYLARSLATRLNEEKLMRQDEQALAREDEKEDKAHQRELERLRLEMEQERELKRIEADNLKDIEKIQADKDKYIAKNAVKKVSSQASNGQDDIGQSGVKGSRIDAILDEIRHNGRFNKTDLSNRLDISRQTLYNDLGNLESEGKIQKNGEGYKVIE